MRREREMSVRIGSSGPWSCRTRPKRDPTRRRILAALATGAPATATDLADRLPISRQAIAKHLGLLTDAGLVRGVPGERRRIRFHVQSAPMATAQSFLAARDRDSHLGALQAHLDRTRPDREQGK
jgi:DNA-binding transcriptional ArsR family regulator